MPPSVITPKALANLSPGLERQRQPWEHPDPFIATLKGFVLRETLSGFDRLFISDPRVVADAPTLG
jgi:hypothetical protein